MRLVVTGGGTGGHVYPALSIVEALLAIDEAGVSAEDVCWTGAAASIEEGILSRTPLAFYPLAAGAVKGAGPVRVLGNLVKTAQGVVQALRLIRRLRPDAILATGGYVSVPTVVAGWLLGCPTLIYLPDMEPGLAVRFLARLARRVAVSFDSVADHLPPGKALVSGYPVRAALYHGDRQRSQKALGLAPNVPTLLILGGSRGARSINQAVAQDLDRLLSLAQVVHISGPGDLEALRSARELLAPERQRRYHLYDYMHEKMVDALAAADLIVARAGASVLGEFPAVGAPSILAPYPYAGPNQQVNANYLAERGAAIVVPDGELQKRLLSEIETLLASPERLANMAHAARQLARPSAARVIAEELVALAKEKMDG